jgi:hypothetical protein
LRRLRWAFRNSAKKPPEPCGQGEKWEQHLLSMWFFSPSRVWWARCGIIAPRWEAAGAVHVFQEHNTGLAELHSFHSGAANHHCPPWPAWRRCIWSAVRPWTRAIRCAHEDGSRELEGGPGPSNSLFYRPVRIFLENLEEAVSFKRGKIFPDSKQEQTNPAGKT